MTDNTVCIVQARMGSTRLPGKVLKTLNGRSMLWWVIERVKKAQLVEAIVIATTLKPEDDTIIALCEAEDWLYFRGSAGDVLNRYYQAAIQFKATDIVRITSDCPLIDPAVINYVIAAYHSAAPPVDYASNFLERTYPRGLDVEIFGFESLEKAWREDTSAWREHVTPYIHQQPDKFRLLSVTNPVDYAHHRWTVDTIEDYEFVNNIYTHFGHAKFTWQDVLLLLEDNPEWVDINRHIEQKDYSNDRSHYPR